MMEKLPNDPVLLLGVVNTKLRDYYPSLEALCEDLDTDQAELEEKLDAVDYHYDRRQNQFI